MSGLSHLDELEAEAIYIIREVAAECEKPRSYLQRLYPLPLKTKGFLVLNQHHFDPKGIQDKA